MAFESVIKPVPARFGAPMGRHTGPEFLGGKCYLRRVPLDRGGYDRGGAYWGIGLPLWEAQDQDGNTAIFRAASRAAAKALLREKFENLRFYR